MKSRFAGELGGTSGKKSMRAAICRNYGGPEVLTIEHSPIPNPAPDEVQIRVKYSSVTSGDARVRSFRNAGFMWPVMRLALGILRPRNPVLGMEYAGVVTKAGSKVSRFMEGDHVFGIGFGGAHAEFMRIKDSSAISKLPKNWSMQDAVALPFGAIAALVFPPFGIRSFIRVKLLFAVIGDIVRLGRCTHVSDWKSRARLCLVIQVAQ